MNFVREIKDDKMAMTFIFGNIVAVCHYEKAYKSSWSGSGEALQFSCYSSLSTILLLQHG